MLGSLLSVSLAVGAASPGEPEVSWQAPAGCSDAAAVRRRIEDLLRRPLAPGEVRVAGVVQAEGSGFVLRLRVRAGEVVDERSLRAERCPTLADTAALVAAVMIDPAVADTVLVPEPDPAPDEGEGEVGGGEAGVGGEAGGAGDGSGNAAGGGGAGDDGSGHEAMRANDAAKAEANEADALGDGASREPAADEDGRGNGKGSGRSRAADAIRTERPDPSRGATGLWLRARAGGEFGAVPEGTGGVAIGLAIGGSRLRAELEGQYWVGRRAESLHGTARIHLGSIVARACGVVPRRPLAAAVCAGLELGAVRADAVEPDRLTRHRPWLAAQAEIALRWQARPRVALWIGAQPFVPIVFPRFELRDPGAPDAPETIHAPTSVGIRGLLGVELRAFPARLAAPR